jgi:ABC-2 type transport system ATP-binding protein
MIATEKLSKGYGQTRAVDELDLKVGAGEIFGFLGPNGAGKTTTIRILTTLTKPSSGRARVDGFDVVGEAARVKKVIGVVQQHLSLDRELTVAENMEVHARLHHLSSHERRRRMAELLEYVELAQQAGQLVSDLSGGMKRRAMIARALLHRPKVLFLDEPTVGLDPHSRRRLWDLIRRMNADGSTVFLTTHYIEEAEALCHRVGILHEGRLIALGSPRELRQRLGLVAVEVVVDGATSYRFFADPVAARAHVQTLPSDARTLVVRDTNLEDVFVELTGRKVVPNG